MRLNCVPGAAIKGYDLIMMPIDIQLRPPNDLFDESDHSFSCTWCENPRTVWPHSQKVQNTKNFIHVHHNWFFTMSSHSFRLPSMSRHLPGIGRFVQTRLLCVSSSQPLSGEDVVISGISCRLPSCDNFSEFSQNLRNGTDMVGEQTRFQSVQVPRRMGLLRSLDKFDAAFFRTPPKLAETSDPQIRMLLEVVFETIVDAGKQLTFTSAVGSKPPTY